MLSVLSAYWELWYAEQALVIQQQGLEVAKRELDEARQRRDPQ